MEDTASKDNRDVLARSQSWAVIHNQGGRQEVRKQSDPFADQAEYHRPVPIHEAQSYKPSKEQQEQQKEKRRLLRLDALVEHGSQPADCRHSALLSRHSAASLKVHFRSIDDISNDNRIDDNESSNGCHNEGSNDDCFHRRSQSEAASWSASGSDLTGHGGEDDQEEEEAYIAPDGGYGWVIVAASFVVNLLADGVTFSFGILFVELLSYFKESRGYTAWINGIFMAMPLLSGPLASSLTDRYGCRAVTIVGSILAALGFILSSVSQSLELLFLTFGIISGFGLSLCYVAAIVIVAYYFEKRRSLATGLAVCGSGIGTFIFAPLTQYLIDEYGWRGAMLIVAGFFLNMCVCGALMRPLEGTGRRSRMNTSRRNISRSVSEHLTVGPRSRNCSESEHSAQFCPSTPEPSMTETDGMTKIFGGEFNLSPPDVVPVVADTRLCNSLINLPTFLDHGEKIPHEVLMTITNNPRLYSIVLDNYPALFDGFIINRYQDDDDDEEKPASGQGIIAEPNKDPSKSLPAEATDMLARDSSLAHGPQNHHHWNTAYLKGLKVKKTSLTYRGAMLNLPRYRLRASSCPDIYRNSITTIAREKEGACWDYLEELREVLMDMFDFSYLSNPRFVMFAISNALLYCWYHVFYIYVVDLAIEKGQPDDEDASFLLSVVGILNMAGVVILGYIGDRSWANPTWIYSASMLLCGLSTAAVPLLSTYTGLATASGLFGLSIAANYSLASVILVDLISLERFVNAYGLLLLFQGVANLVGPPLAGWIRDVTGQYDASFYVAGVFIVLSGAILVMLPICRHVRNRISTPSNNGSLEDGMLSGSGRDSQRQPEQSQHGPTKINESSRPDRPETTISTAI